MSGFQSKRKAAQERFGQVFEDPMYDEDGVLVDEDYEEPNGWYDVDTAPLGTIVESWVRQTVAEKQQDELSPFVTINS